MLMDSRSNLDSDIHTAVTVTAIGTATEVRKENKEPIVERYRSRHPYLREFLGAASSALIEVAVDTYYLVTRFQQVLVFAPGSARRPVP